MKLQKLVYFAYGWYFAYFDQPLFGETIYAWRHGPVVADLYGHFKRYGGNPIEHISPSVRYNLNEDVISILDEVWETYASATDIQLSDITHRIDAPWAKVYSQYKWGADIKPLEIREYFKTLKDKFDNDPT